MIDELSDAALDAAIGALVGGTDAATVGGLCDRVAAVLDGADLATAHVVLAFMLAHVISQLPDECSGTVSLAAMTRLALRINAAQGPAMAWAAGRH